MKLTDRNGQKLVLDLRLSKFARYIRIYGTDLLSVISDTHRGTLFAPSNDAFDVMTQEEIEELLADPVQGNHKSTISLFFTEYICVCGVA